ncbi:MAG: YdcF family protein [Clostridia bacterium]|nr:YdcF family protein [Clostridia bacterium]
MKKRLKIIIILALTAALAAAILSAVNAYVVFSAKDRVFEKADFAKIENADCILVLGAGVRDETPSPMLKDRLDCALYLYNGGKAPKIIMSGDHGTENYDEVNVMKNYAVEKGVPSCDVFMDHAGFSSYDSIYRAKEIFGAKKIIIVTQKYHLYRSLYIAKSLGLDACGAVSDARPYAGRRQREVREVFARNKDFFMCLFKPYPRFLGEKISLEGSGDETNDK